MKKFICLFIILLTSLHTLGANAYSKPTDISVSDYAGILTESSKNYIKSKNEILFSQTEAKIVFVTVPSTNDTSISDYCQNLYSQWEMQYFGRGNSVFFVVDAENKDYNFVIGNNIKLALTEDLIYEYVVDYFEPYFSKGEYEKAVLSLYNAIGKWYENNYVNLNLALDDNIDKYSIGPKTRDSEKSKSNIMLWIGVGVSVVAIVVVLKVRRNIQLKIRKHERQRLKKKYKIDIDKIINS